jgi:hypothetical protein
MAERASGHWRSCDSGSRNSISRLGLLGITLFVASVLSLVAFSPIADAAGNGYGSGSSTGSGSALTVPDAPAGFSSILTSATVQPSGGTVSSGGVTVTVPSGAFSSPIEVVISEGTISGLTGLPSGANPVLAFGVSFLQNGVKYTGLISPPVTVSISNSDITSADELLSYNTSSNVYALATQNSNIENIVISNGTITFQVSGDPFVVISASASTTSVPGATATVTGFPLVGESILGALLVLGGIALALRIRARRRLS